MVIELTTEKFAIDFYRRLLSIISYIAKNQDNGKESVINYKNIGSQDYLDILEIVGYIRRQQGNAAKFEVSRWSCGTTNRNSTEGMFLNILITNNDGTTDFYWFLK